MTTRRPARLAAAGLAVATLAAVAATVTGASRATDPPRGAEPVRLDPAEFTTRITNPYWPMRPGTRWVYRETAPDGTRQRVTVTVTRRTRRIANGVTARVVRDVVTEDGALVEVTDDWYAQDRRGNVWYLGERTSEYRDGRVVSTHGSFEAGVGGAEAGVVMPAAPRPGMRYRQEYLRGEAEDRAEVIRLGDVAETPLGRFRDVLVTRDTNPLGRGAVELKFYARGVGPVLVVGTFGDDGREELVSLRRGG